MPDPTMKSANYHTRGLQDGLTNKPREKGIKPYNKPVYEAGYQEGQKLRSLRGRQDKESA